MYARLVTGSIPIEKLDATLIDTVYAHVFAWRQALSEATPLAR